jgi:hypothetical protein
MELTATFFLSVLIEYWYIIPIIFVIFFFKIYFFTSLAPSLDQFPVESYGNSFALGRLTPGVDNNRYDVYLSSAFCKSSKQFILRVIEENALPGKKRENNRKHKSISEQNQFEKDYREIMTLAINRAKTEREIQIDYIARTAIAKMLIREIQDAYDTFIADMNSVIWKKELSRRYASDDPIALKAEFYKMRSNKWQIIQATGKIIFDHLNQVDQRELNGLRKSNSGMDGILPGDLFLNPFFHAGKTDDYFMMETYDILPGQRIEDADNYTLLLSTLRIRFRELIFMGQTRHPENRVESDTPQPKPDGKNLNHLGKESLIGDKKVDAWIKQVGNVDILFDYISTKKKYSSLKKEGGEKEELRFLRQKFKRQHRMLLFFYKKLADSGMLKGICAYHEIRLIYTKYCPPLVPRMLLQFMTVPSDRKAIIKRQRRVSKISHVPFQFSPLKRCQKRVKWLRTSEKKERLIRFFKGFFRYHRDLENFRLMKKAMTMIRLLKDENHVRLSRVNNTLYEFLLPHELGTEVKQVINHTILKADIRGSTRIVHEMKEKGLNPASYFSLNMFDPITQIIPEYGAFKVFIEGDAIILGIYEREERPEEWYSIARACGLAIQILLIIDHYNRKNRKHNLPFLEIGIGITFHNEPPTLFFDGDFQIMISPAINSADRLSGCSRVARKIIDSMDKPFNNYVFQTASNEDVAASSDDISTRYNVNGIEVHPQAFHKLSREIKLRPVECIIPEIQPEKIKFFTGTFPTVTGQSQLLIIREGSIPQVHEKDFSLIAMTHRTYYEVCTNEKVYDYFKKHVR